MQDALIHGRKACDRRAYEMHGTIGARRLGPEQAGECESPMPATWRPLWQEGAAHARIHKDEVRKAQTRAGPYCVHAQLAQQRSMAAVIVAAVPAGEHHEASARMRLQCDWALPAVDDECK